jgi:hypothetical protein
MTQNMEPNITECSNCGRQATLQSLNTVCNSSGTCPGIMSAVFVQKSKEKLTLEGLEDRYGVSLRHHPDYPCTLQAHMMCKGECACGVGVLETAMDLISYLETSTFKGIHAENYDIHEFTVVIPENFDGEENQEEEVSMAVVTVGKHMECDGFRILLRVHAGPVVLAANHLPLAEKQVRKARWKNSEDLASQDMVRLVSQAIEHLEKVCEILEIQQHISPYDSGAGQQYPRTLIADMERLRKRLCREGKTLKN